MNCLNLVSQSSSDARIMIILYLWFNGNILLNFFATSFLIFFFLLRVMLAVILFISSQRFHISYHTFRASAKICRFCKLRCFFLESFISTVRDEFHCKASLESAENYQIEFLTMSQLNRSVTQNLIVESIKRPPIVPDGLVVECFGFLTRPTGDRIFF